MLVTLAGSAGTAIYLPPQRFTLSCIAMRALPNRPAAWSPTSLITTDIACLAHLTIRNQMHNGTNLASTKQSRPSSNKTGFQLTLLSTKAVQVDNQEAVKNGVTGATSGTRALGLAPTLTHRPRSWTLLYGSSLVVNQMAPATAVLFASMRCVLALQLLYQHLKLVDGSRSTSKCS